jgi:CheY-like chemotaxis protein/anti-sigma regulatory factor (Ser/Thr protein kinase)
MAELVRVVVVDDVIEVRRLLRSTLRFSGQGRFAVVGDASTGAEAIAITERLQPQVVVLDLGLPDLSGQHLVARIREAAPYARIVVFTGSDPDDEEWFARRTSGYVLKDQLATLVDTLIAISEPSTEDSISLSLPRDPASLAVAREHVRSQLHAWGLPSLVDAAVLVVSELGGNAVEHARTGFDLRLQVRQGRAVRVEVLDHGPGSPDLRAPDTTSERGRGLLLVSQLTASWGVETISGNGKRVWAELLVD